MKPFILFALLCLLILYGCKKQDTNQTITVQVTGITSETTFNLQIQNAAGGSPDFELQNSATNGNYSIVAQSGETLNVSWKFITQGQQYGQGKVIVMDGSKTLFTINGGYSIEGNTFKVP